MGLYWVVRRNGEGQKLFYVQDGDSPIDATVKSAAAGFEGLFADVFFIDTQTAARLTKDDVGRALSMDEARDIIEGRKGSIPVA